MESCTFGVKVVNMINIYVEQKFEGNVLPSCAGPSDNKALRAPQPCPLPKSQANHFHVPVWQRDGIEIDD